MVFASTTNVGIGEIDKLRSECRGAQVQYLVAKKSLITRALADAGQSDVDVKGFTGTIAVALGMGDEVSPAKLLARFAKDHETFAILGGVLEGRSIAVSEVKSLAALPSREELLAKMVGSMNAPISGFVNTLAGVLRNMVGVLNAIKDAKGNA